MPEILDGIVEIKAWRASPDIVRRSPSSRNDRNVDPVGACVGAKGSRVRMVMNELRGEKIDIIKWTDEHSEFVANALSPAKVKEVRLQDAADGARDRARLPAVARDRQGRPERSPGGAPHRSRVDIKSESQIRQETEAGGARSRKRRKSRRGGDDPRGGSRRRSERRSDD